MASKLAKKVFNATRSKPVKMPSATPLGSPGYDNPRDDIEKVKKLREGSIEKVPANNNDITNKAYVDTEILTAWLKTLGQTGLTGDKTGDFNMTSTKDLSFRDVTATRQMNITSALNPALIIKDTRNDVETIVRSSETFGFFGMISNHALLLATNSAARMILSADGTLINFLTSNLSTTGDLSIGNITFTQTGKGLVYGTMSVVSNANETAIATQNVYVQVIDFDTNGVSNNSSPDHTNDHILITKAGDYKIECCITANSIAGAGATFEFEIKKNNGNVRVGAAHGDRTLAGGGSEAGAITICTIATLAVNDTIELWTKNESNTQNIIVEDASLSVMQVGG